VQIKWGENNYYELKKSQGKTGTGKFELLSETIYGLLTKVEWESRSKIAEKGFANN
jgi:hypothetical protein